MIDNVLKLLTPKNEVAFLNSNMTIRQGLEKFKIHGYKAVPVINDDGTYHGIITEGDFLWTIINNGLDNIKELENTLIKDMNINNINSCKIDVSIDELINRITNNNFVPIVDDRNILMGIITRRSVINSLVNN